jgi:hypothetical protein
MVDCSLLSIGVVLTIFEVHDCRDTEVTDSFSGSNTPLRVT